MSLTANQAYLAATVGGAVLWQATVILTGQREAWDAPMYWMVAYPLAIAIAGVLAWANPERPWRWALVTMWIQAVVMVLFSGSSFSLLPLGLILFGVLALPPIGIATMVASMKRKRQL